MIYGVYYALTEGVAKALVADLAPKEARGTAFGWFHSVEGVAVIPASIIFGLFYNWRPWFAFSFGATLALAAAVLLIIFVPSKVPTESIENPEAKPQEVA
jgi:MFS family permease